MRIAVVILASISPLQEKTRSMRDVKKGRESLLIISITTLIKIRSKETWLERLEMWHSISSEWWIPQAPEH
jgi:hypothetical protein